MKRQVTYHPGYIVSGENVYLIPDVARKNRWRTSKRSPANVAGGQSGSFGMPDIGVRMSHVFSKLKGRQHRMLNPVIPDDILFEETYFDLRKNKGMDRQSAQDIAFEMASRQWQRKQSYPSKAKGLLDNPAWMMAIMYGGLDPMTALQHTAAPTLENARKAGIAVGPGSQGNQIAPRNVAAGGLGSTHQSRQQALSQSTARRAAAGMPTGINQEVVLRQYTSTDGEVYAIHTRTGNQPAEGGFQMLMLHAFAEMIKGGDPLTVLGGCQILDLHDATGKVVINFLGAFEAKYGNPDEAPTGAGDMPKGVSLG